MTKISWKIPGLKTVSEANTREHWTKKSKRHQVQQWIVRNSFNLHCPGYRLPCTITLTRLAPRNLDSDNLVSSQKFVRDELAACMFPEKISEGISRSGKHYLIKGHCDNNPLVSWKYAQEKSKTQGVRIEIEF